MLQNNPFYWGTIHKVVIAFGAVFSDIHIVRQDKNGNPVKTIEVPCNFAPAEKWMRRNKQNPMPGVDDQVEMVLPRMSYEIGGFAYDPDRKLTTTGRTVKAVTSSNQVLVSQFNPVPYNIQFTLNIMTKTMEDSLMIVEQILPFFTPDYTITVKDIPELNLLKDLPIVLNSVAYEDTYSGAMNERRTIIWTLQFTVKAYLYPPTGLTKVNLRTNIQWRLTSDFINAQISQNDQFTPIAGSTSATFNPEKNTVYKQVEAGVMQLSFGRSRIASPYRFQIGTSRIGNFQNQTHFADLSGRTNIQNPLEFRPGFQSAPLQTLAGDSPTPGLSQIVPPIDDDMLLSKTLVLDQAKLFALDTTPVIWIPAPPLGKMITLMKVSWDFDANGSAYYCVDVTNNSIQARGGSARWVSTVTDLLTYPGFAGQSNAIDGYHRLEAQDDFKISAQNSLAGGPITGSSVAWGGTGYVAGEELYLNPQDATLIVDTVDGNGTVLTYHLTNAGTAYGPGTYYAQYLTSGNGVGLQITVTSVQPAGSGSLTLIAYYVLTDFS